MKLSALTLLIAMSLLQACGPSPKKALAAAKEALTGGYNHVAWGHLEPVKHVLAKDKEACPTLINTASLIQDSFEISWAAEACHQAGHKDLKEIYLGLAKAQEYKGNLMAAMGILEKNLKDFETIPDLFYRLGYLQDRAKNKKAAAMSYLRAAANAPTNGNLQAEIMNYMAVNKEWKAGASIADRLKLMEVKNPNVKFLMGRVYTNADRPADATAQIDMAKAAMATSPAPLQAQLRVMYPEFLEGGKKPASAKK